MLRKKSLGMMAFALAAGFAGGACSDSNDTDDVVVDERVAVIDVNNDLVVDANEMAAAFALFDVNGDGVLTPDEFRFNATGFTSLDTNADGVITIDEWNAAMTTWDANGDAFLEDAEFDPFL